MSGVDIGGSVSGRLPCRLAQRHESHHIHGTAQQKEGEGRIRQLTRTGDAGPPPRRRCAWSGRTFPPVGSGQTPGGQPHWPGGLEEAEPHVSGGQPRPGAAHERDDAMRMGFPPGVVLVPKIGCASNRL